ncbi:MAG: septum formation initiator family protein [Bacteroidales bacterium]|nr:septum formation initiator family protein [Bacteroidales bacterium]
MLEIFSKIPNFIRSRYFIAGCVFIVWVSFFDENNLMERVQLIKQLKQLEKDEKYYLKQIDKDKNRLNELRYNKNLEKFAREQYLMKKPNEDIYVILAE